MEKTDGVGWGELVARGLAITLVVTMLLAFFPGWQMVGKLFAERDAPAWVQAVGSIAAIFAAIGIAAWQRHQEHAKQRHIEAERLISSAKLYADTRASCERFIGTASAAMSMMQAELLGDQRKVMISVRASGVAEALEMARTIDLSPLTVFESTTVVVARSICSQLLVLLAEEKVSQARPPFQYLCVLLPEYIKRMNEAELAWVQRRLPAAPDEVKA